MDEQGSVLSPNFSTTFSCDEVQRIERKNNGSFIFTTMTGVYGSRVDSTLACILGVSVYDEFYDLTNTGVDTNKSYLNTNPFSFTTIGNYPFGILMRTFEKFSNIVNGKYIRSELYFNDTGSSIDYVLNFLRYNAGGGIDPTMPTYPFNVHTENPGGTTVLELLPNEQFILGVENAVYPVQGIKKNFVRFNKNGTLDSTFNRGSGANGRINQMIFQNKMIYLSGDFTTFDSKSYNGLARLTDNGDIDTTFDIGTGFNGAIRKMVLQKDGHLIVVGDFTQINGKNVNRIVRLLPNGKQDLNFYVGSGANNRISDVALLKSGKIVLLGDFTKYQGQLHKHMLF